MSNSLHRLRAHRAETSYEYVIRKVSTARLRPRVRNAIRLYATNGAATQKDAALAVGLHPVTLGLYLKHNKEAQAMLANTDKAIEDKTIDTAALLKELSLKALKKLGHLAENGSTEAIQLKAAIDLADRGPETSKVQKSVSAGLTLDGQDAKSLAAALVSSSNVTTRFFAEVQNDYEKVKIDSPSTLPDNADRSR